MNRTCRGCTAPIKPGPRERNQKQWCSMACRNRYQRHAGVYADSYVPKSSIDYADCSVCGDLFVLRTRGRHPEGPACYRMECQRARTARRAKDWHARYKQQNGKTAGGKRKLHPSICVGCEAPFQGRKGSRYCTRTCYQRFISDNTKRVDGKHYNRKQRLRRATVSAVSRTAIFDRDRWTCHLCGKRIDHRLRHPDPHSASIDHLVPLACGGTHEPANVAAAHLVCNLRKGYQGHGEQLALIG